MSALVTTETLEEKIEFEKSNLFTGMYARIESYYKSKGTAKVQPLAKIKTDDGYKELPVVTLPVNTYFGDGYRIIPPLKKGDVVYLGAGLYPTVNTIKGKAETNDSRKHTIENMVILGAVDPALLNPLCDEDGLVICNNESATRIVVKKSLIEFKVGTKSTQKALLGEDTRKLVENILDVILKLIVMTPAGPSSPISTMPKNVLEIEKIRAKLDSLLSPGIKNN